MIGYMQSGIPIFPQEASTVAPSVDHLFFYLFGVTAFFAILVFALIFYFAIKYRRRSPDELPPPFHEPMALEITWIVVPFILMMVMFVWGAKIYYREFQPPADAMEIFVVGKQWMWKIQHADGKREIDELHIPVGRPVKLTMTSEDVIHDFFVPAFRVKKDVVPGHYSTMWFEATKVGRYRFFCSQYCGAHHASMRGYVYVMTPSDYERWLTGGVKAESMAAAGAELYQRLACVTCHGTGKGPPFRGIYGKPVKLSDGRSVMVDDPYIRESILYPSAKIVAGYSPIMPTFKGQVSEEQVLQLIAYIKSLSAAEKETSQ